MGVLHIIRAALIVMLALNPCASADTFALTQPVDQGIRIELVEPQDASVLAHRLLGAQALTIMGKILASNQIIVATANGVEVSLQAFKQGGGSTFFAKIPSSDRFEIVVMDSEGNTGTLRLVREIAPLNGDESSAGATDPTRIVGAKDVAQGSPESPVNRLRSRSRTAGETRVNLGAGTIVGGGLAGYAGYVDFGYNNLVGQVFPGQAGGWWHGLAIEPRAQVGYMRLEKREICKRIAGTTYEKCSGGYMYDAFDWQAGLILGYTVIRFGTLDAESSNQHGWGLKLGAFGGAVGRGSGVATFAVAPVLSLLRPIYHANRGDMRSLSVNVMVLPQKTTTLFVGAGLGF